jgi:hypothetical protein
VQAWVQPRIGLMLQPNGIFEEVCTRLSADFASTS